MTDDQYIARRIQIEKEVDDLIKHNKDLSQRPNEPGAGHQTGILGGIFGDPGTTMRTRDEEVAKRLQDAGLSATLHDHQADRSRPRPQPIPEGARPDSLPPEQQQSLQALATLAQQIPAAGWIPQRTQTADLRRLREIETLYRRWGSLRAMPLREQPGVIRDMTRFGNTYRRPVDENAGDATSTGDGGDW